MALIMEFSGVKGHIADKIKLQGLVLVSLGPLKGTYRVFSKYTRIPGYGPILLGTHGFNLRHQLGMRSERRPK